MRKVWIAFVTGFSERRFALHVDADARRFSRESLYGLGEMTLEPMGVLAAVTRHDVRVAVTYIRIDLHSPVSQRAFHLVTSRARGTKSRRISDLGNSRPTILTLHHAYYKWSVASFRKAIYVQLEFNIRNEKCSEKCSFIRKVYKDFKSMFKSKAFILNKIRDRDISRLDFTSR